MFEGRRRPACHHEAGHALARWYLGHATDAVVVLSMADIRAGRWPVASESRARHAEGYVLGRDIHDLCDASRWHRSPLALRAAQVERDHDLIEAFAGPLAEAAHERSYAFQEYWTFGGAGDRERVDDVLATWRLDDAERQTAWTLARRRASVLVRSRAGTAAVKAMVALLVGQGELRGDGIDALCRQAYGGLQPALSAWIERWPPTLADIRDGVLPVVQATAAS